jgi:hypothetical protein
LFGGLFSIGSGGPLTFGIKDPVELELFAVDEEEEPENIPKMSSSFRPLGEETGGFGAVIVGALPIFTFDTGLFIESIVLVELMIFVLLMGCDEVLEVIPSNIDINPLPLLTPLTLPPTPLGLVVVFKGGEVEDKISSKSPPKDFSLLPGKTVAEEEEEEEEEEKEEVVLSLFFFLPFRFIPKEEESGAILMLLVFFCIEFVVLLLLVDPSNGVNGDFCKVLLPTPITKLLNGSSLSLIFVLILLLLLLLFFVSSKPNEGVAGELEKEEPIDTAGLPNSLLPMAPKLKLGAVDVATLDEEEDNEPNPLISIPLLPLPLPPPPHI